jgi:hypothetical protein
MMPLQAVYMALGSLAGSNLYFACRSSYNSITYTRRVRGIHLRRDKLGIGQVR